jgi:hypothetical protein
MSAALRVPTIARTAACAACDTLRSGSTLRNR